MSLVYLSPHFEIFHCYVRWCSATIWFP